VVLRSSRGDSIGCEPGVSQISWSGDSRSLRLPGRCLPGIHARRNYLPRRSSRLYHENSAGGDSRGAAIADLREALEGLIAEFGVSKELTLTFDVA
jgi:hypothetical protein